MVTIKDIARECGVSPATVSKALNGYGDINPVTAEGIRAKAQEMNYHPNLAARQLKTNISRNIGVVFEDETNSGLAHEHFSRILNSAKDEAEHLGYDITFISEVFGGSFVEHCRNRKCDGVLITTADFAQPSIVELVDSEIPTVSIDYAFENQTCIMSDNMEGEYRLTRYLIEQGHRKIAFIHGEKTAVTIKRLRGFYQACQEAGIEVPDAYVIEGKYHETSNSAIATRSLMQMRNRPTAILYPDDYAYIGGSTELRNMGIRVPEDVSVAGYDGIGLSQVLSPKLTTWCQDTDKIGRCAARKLVELIESKGKAKAEQVLVSGRLQKGESVSRVS
ncbi:MAG: LacI family DNA-binding transcriptional regulator [Eubacterium sp.]|nr:LacI family DNA-binding transcriptional regulator [Eubacterium sp.]